MIYFLFVWLFISIILTFIYAPPAEGFKGESYRIVFYHIPMAWIAVIAFFLSAYNSLMYLRKKDFVYDIKSKSLISLGLTFSLLATISGAIFAKIEWGLYWNWDPRQISISLLLFIYAAYLILRSSIENPKLRANLSAVYSLFSFFTVPFLVFVIPRVYFSLHPDTIINIKGNIQMKGEILYTFLSTLIGFTILFFQIYKIDWATDYELFKKEYKNE